MSAEDERARAEAFLADSDARRAYRRRRRRQLAGDPEARRTLDDGWRARVAALRTRRPQ